MPEPKTINIEPNWENMRRWVENVAKTDPDLARKIAEEMGSEAPMTCPRCGFVGPPHEVCSGGSRYQGKGDGEA